MWRAKNIALTVFFGIVIGVLIGFALGFTHGGPTAENASPPPEAFDYPTGIFVGLITAIVARAIVWPLWQERRRSRSAN
jgi:Na+/H+-dicarboxylate symporter